MAYRSSTTANGTDVSGAVAVPAGAAVNDIALLHAVVDNTTHLPFTWPSGFTQLFGSSQASPDGQCHGLAWKRLTGADSGTYAVSWAGTADDYHINCLLFSGRSTATDPTATENVNTTSNPNPITVTATGLTALAGDDLCWIVGGDITIQDGGTSFAPPSGFTEQIDNANTLWTDSTGATQDNVSAGATGDKSGTWTTTANGGWTAYLVRLPAAPSSTAQAVAGMGWGGPRIMRRTLGI
jgi:hypothetical protein